MVPSKSGWSGGSSPRPLHPATNLRPLLRSRNPLTPCPWLYAAVPWPFPIDWELPRLGPLAGCRQTPSSVVLVSLFSSSLSPSLHGLSPASSLLRDNPTSLPTSHRGRCLPSALPCCQGSAEISWGKAMNFPAALSSIQIGLLGISGIVFAGTLTRPTCLTRLHFRSGLQFVFRLPPHTASRLMRLPSTRGCLPKAPQGSFTL